jgi:hypothetical protein
MPNACASWPSCRPRTARERPEQEVPDEASTRFFTATFLHDRAAQTAGEPDNNGDMMKDRQAIRPPRRQALRTAMAVAMAASTRHARHARRPHGVGPEVPRQAHSPGGRLLRRRRRRRGRAPARCAPVGRAGPAGAGRKPHRRHRPHRGRVRRQVAARRLHADDGRQRLAHRQAAAAQDRHRPAHQLQAGGGRLHLAADDRHGQRLSREDTGRTGQGNQGATPRATRSPPRAWAPCSTWVSKCSSRPPAAPWCTCRTAAPRRSCPTSSAARFPSAW